MLIKNIDSSYYHYHFRNVNMFLTITVRKNWFDLTEIGLKHMKIELKILLKHSLKKRELIYILDYFYI